MLYQCVYIYIYSIDAIINRSGDKDKTERAFSAPSPARPGLGF